MKFWKQSLLSALAVIGIASTVLYTACEKDNCSNLTCQNNGACVSGSCHCPTGYEGTQCETHSVDRYLGTYYGTTACNGLTTIIDTVDVFKSGNDLITVGMVKHSDAANTYYGTISNANNTYFINVPQVNDGSGQKNVSATVDGKKLNLNIQVVVNGNSSSCVFRGTKP
jgi:hypothetical protein